MSDCAQLFQERHRLQTLLQHVFADDARQNILDQLADVEAQIQAQGCVEPVPPPPPVLKHQMTRFRPEIEGFAFMNEWFLDDTEKNTILKLFQAGIGPVAGLVAPLLAPATGLLDVLLAPFIPPGTVELAAVITATSGKLNDLLLKAPLSHDFGLCGGMAYTSLDYYKANMIIQRGFSDFANSPGQPDRNTPEGTLLRNYLLQRMFDTFATGSAATKTLWYMALLHLVPVDLSGGAPAVLKSTKDEWVKLKQHLDAGEPWPIGIVGATTLDPTHNHQVLAIGYDETAIGGTIYIYDNTYPDHINTITFNLTGSELIAQENAHPNGVNPKRGPLKGFFCDDYSFSSPPVAVGITQSPTITPPGPYTVGQQVTVTYTAANVGYGSSPPLKLYVRGQQLLTTGLPFPGEHIDFISPTEAAAAAQIDSRLSGQAPHDVVSTNTTSRQLVPPAELNIPQPGNWFFFAEAWLGNFDGKDIYKTLPIVQKPKESKEGKEGKESKDKDKEKEASKERKDNKENLKEKDHPKENAKEKDRDFAGFTGGMKAGGPVGMILPSLAHNESNEQLLATGQAFIRPEERPDVGGRILQQSAYE